ncbi:MAG: hypothetical protein GY799_21705 [Desulfobulbaceae bacterium]|nr:hypothetical protein [Desulfobulbaceae bacterium]
MLFFLICLLVVLSFFRTSMGKGIWGEFVVNLMAKRFLDKEKYHLIKNVTLPTEAGTTQVDHIIVSQYGIFVVETKNMKGWIFGSKNQKDWTQKIYKSNTKFQNPLRQNYKHTKTLSLLLGVEHSKIFSLIVFVGDSTFKTEMPENITHGMGYIRYIRSKTSRLFSESDVFGFVNMISKKRLKPSLKTHRDHVAHVKSIHSYECGQNGQDKNKIVGGVEPGLTWNHGDLTQTLISDLGNGRKSERGLSGEVSSRGEQKMSKQKNPLFFFYILKVALVVCAGIVVVVLATLYLQPAISNFLDEKGIKKKLPVLQAENVEKTESSSKAKASREYNFTEAQINRAINEVEKSREPMPPSQPTDGNRSLYEIEFVSGGRAYSENVIAKDELITFENERGLVVSVSKNEVKNLKRLIQNGPVQSANYTCRGKTHCSQMTSCEEARFYLRNCPGTKIDGDGNGVPCEKQWCGQ